MKEEDQTCKAPLTELMQSDLDHYEKASTAIHCWHNQIPQAIEFWYKSKMENLNNRFTYFIENEEGEWLERFKVKKNKDGFTVKEFTLTTNPNLAWSCKNKQEAINYSNENMDWLGYTFKVTEHEFVEDINGGADWEVKRMRELIDKKKDESHIPKFKLGEVVKHNKVEVRITAFRYEIRPMGTFKIYEVVNDKIGGSSFDVVEHLIERIKK